MRSSLFAFNKNPRAIDQLVDMAAVFFLEPLCFFKRFEFPFGWRIHRNWFHAIKVFNFNVKVNYFICHRGTPLLRILQGHGVLYVIGNQYTDIISFRAVGIKRGVK